MVKNLPANARCKRHGFDPWLRKIPLEEGLATHFSILAWRIPGKEEPKNIPMHVNFAHFYFLKIKFTLI